jgi:heme exporter protein C
MNWFWYASPQTFYPLAGRMAPWFAVVAALLAVAGLYIGFFVAPTDAQQGEVYRVIFIHVPAAWLSMFIYLVMAFWAALGLAFKTRLSGMMASALAPTGALFTFIALWTGSLGAGRPGAPTGCGMRASPRSWCCSSSISASSRCRRRSTIRGAPTAPARCSRSSAW